MAPEKHMPIVFPASLSGLINYVVINTKSVIKYLYDRNLSFA